MGGILRETQAAIALTWGIRDVIIRFAVELHGATGCDSERDYREIIEKTERFQMIENLQFNPMGCGAEPRVSNSREAGGFMVMRQ